ncbi:thiolase family protein [Vagococcus sp. DIV0080]|uniref:acetyl-CoA C-acetyltransferase n=1 Tax=Candidatus Vagococcus giribetii TaxID=2230876 RepID=A0ABS3HSA1_9ENTE|nr:thiolase family protein [Vagococcus sp. DIV0080]MBO0476028.1 thiolase family protein [Vagococcus sp. DIV0080]
MKVYIIDAKRTAIGKFMGGLASVNPVDLTTTVVKQLLADNQVDPELIDELILGNVLSAGHGQNIARQVLLNAGLPEERVAYTLNILCGSGLMTVQEAYKDILLGEADMVLAGGVESMSQSAQILPNYQSRSGLPLGGASIQDTLLRDGLTDGVHGYHMGITAENIADKFNISRQEQDAFAFNSQQKALKAIEAGKFKDEIVPVTVKTRKQEIIIDTDEHPNPKSSVEKLGTLRPAFKKEGTVTAGNASGINDGASVLLIASEKAVETYGLEPMAEIVSFGTAGLDPSIMGLGPVYAIEKALNKTDLTLKDIDIFELNEAFASQSLGVVKELSKQHGLSEEELMSRVNLQGGAIALGHPLGASGARVATTLLHQMKANKELTYGVASLCIGGGMGVAMIIKQVVK